MDVQSPLGPSPIISSRFRQTPIDFIEAIRNSCIHGNIQEFRDILDSYFLDYDPQNTRELSPVMFEAIGQDKTEFITELFDRGLPMHESYALGAIQSKAKNALQIFLRNGWDINSPISELKPPALSFAVEDHDMTAWLLDRGADPNRQCLIDLTPLSYAVENASISTIKLMLQRGGDAKRGQLLHHAIDRQSEVIEVMTLLLEKGASLNGTKAEDYHSKRLYYFMGLGTPLHSAAELGKVDVVHYLISQGAGVNIKDLNGRTPLECAKNSNQMEVVKVLEDNSKVLEDNSKVLEDNSQVLEDNSQVLEDSSTSGVLNWFQLLFCCR